MTNARETMFASIRRSLRVTGAEAERAETVQTRLMRAPNGPIPARGRKPHAEQVQLFVDMVIAAAGTVERVPDANAVPEAIMRHLRAHNLPMRLKRGADPRLEAVPWATHPTLEVSIGKSDGDDLVGLSHAFAGVAETGTLVLHSGADNPTTLNFLPDDHVVMVEAKDIVGDYEAVWERLRTRFGKGVMPRTVNFVTGPSRSGDIEQTLLMGAHGPRRVHVLLVG